MITVCRNMKPVTHSLVDFAPNRKYFFINCKSSWPYLNPDGYSMALKQ